jgi:hypothetical protein
MSEAYRSSAKKPREEVVVATFDTPHEAELARVFLSSRNIEASLKDDTLIQMAQLYSTALGGVKLLTDIEDAEEAQDLLAGYRKRGKKMRERRRRKDKEDDIARRAFRIALIGIFICPGGLHVYALLTLASLKLERLTDSGRRNRTAALAVSWAMIALVVVGILSSW